MKTAYLINTPSTMLICIQTHAPYDNYSKILGISKKEAPFQLLFLINNKGLRIASCSMSGSN